MITKSDFLTFLSAPMHLWAIKHDKIENPQDDTFNQFLASQGFQIEKLAGELIRNVIAKQYSNPRIYWQQPVTDGDYFARLDVLIYDMIEQVYDLYEIKSTTNIRKELHYDLTYQTLVCEAHYNIRDIYLIHINKDYVRGDKVEINSLFVVKSMNEIIDSMHTDVQHLRQMALQITLSEISDGLTGCNKPDRCICPTLCHPKLPHNHIFNIARIGMKANALIENGIVDIHDIPDDFPLSTLQRKQVDAVKSSQPIIDLMAIKQELDTINYPLHFLDYETISLAVPIFEGYCPFEHIVFQYSLDVVDESGAEPIHYEYISIDNIDPGPYLLESLTSQIRKEGTILVWYKPFESGQNQAMASRYPDFYDFLHNMNQRLYDLMEIFRKGMFIHPEFLGSSSLKKVLPALAPDINYDHLSIADGREAMITWWQLVNEDMDRVTRETMISDLKDYCKMDTFAIYTIWRILTSISEEKSE